MFNKTERLQIEMGRDNRWQNSESKGFTIFHHLDKPIIPTNMISPKSRKAMEKTGRMLK